MDTIKSNNSFLYFLITFIVYFFSLYTPIAEAAPRTSEQLGASGWSLPTAEYVGIDTTTCGPSATVGQIQLVEEGSNTPVGNSFAPTFNTLVQDKDGNIVEEFWTVGSNLSKKFCYQLSSDYVRVYTLSNPYYLEHLGVYVGMKPQSPGSYYGHSFLGRVHLKREGSGPQNIAPVSPLDSDNYSEQSYIMDTRSIPNIYNSTELLKTVHILVDATSGARTQTVLNSSGSSGLQTMSPLGLTDGFYLWGFFVALNGDETLSNGLRLNNGIPVSASTQAVWFTIDSTPPTDALDLSLVSTTSTQVNVTITNDVQDLISGTNYTTIYLRETSPGTSESSVQIPLINGSQSSQRASISATLTPGSTYEFYARTVDVVGNITTPTIKTYTAPLNPVVVETYPDLVSQNFTVSAGPYNKNNSIFLNAEAKNIGAENTIFMSRNRFSYSWDEGETWNESYYSIVHGSVVVGGVVTDADSFVLSQAGNLLLRHCVDINSQIDEGPLGESPNCSTVGPITVTELPEAELSGSGCTIPNSGTDNSCNGRLYWNYNFTTSPVIYNLTTNQVYSNDHEGNNFAAVLKYGPNVIQARSIGAGGVYAVLKQITLTASCDEDISFWDGTFCAPKPLLRVSPDFNTVRSGKTAQLTFGIDSNVDLSCTIYGIDIPPSTFNHYANASEITYPYTTRPLTSAQIIQLTCAAPGVSVSEQARISVVPIPEEV